jgi:hypothetical protein
MSVRIECDGDNSGVSVCQDIPVRQGRGDMDVAEVWKGERMGEAILHPIHPLSGS